MRKWRIAVALLGATTAGLLATAAAMAFGVFGSPSSIAAQNVFQIDLGDLNGDGKTDLVASNDGSTANGFVFALGTGDGAFKPSKFVPVSGDQPDGVAIGKFSGDRRPDVAVSDLTDGSISLLFGKKGGGFRKGPVTAAGPGAFQMRTADFNEDGRTDLVSCNYNSTGPAAISVLIQKRKGGFKPHRDVSGVSDCYGIDVGRLNADKHVDVVEQSASGPFAVLLGKGDGSFRPHSDHFTLTSNDGYDNVSIGDFTDDHRDDVAAASFNEERVLVYPGNRSGSLKAPRSTSLGVTPQGIEAADYNRDGKMDLAIAGYTDPQLSVLIGNGNGTFQGTPHTAPEHGTPVVVTAGRVNRDKAPDILVGSGTVADVYLNGNP